MICSMAQARCSRALGFTSSTNGCSRCCEGKEVKNLAGIGTTSQAKAIGSRSGDRRRVALRADDESQPDHRVDAPKPDMNPVRGRPGSLAHDWQLNNLRVLLSGL